jgi:hypothetical protein
MSVFGKKVADGRFVVPTNNALLFGRKGWRLSEQ